MLPWSTSPNLVRRPALSSTAMSCRSVLTLVLIGLLIVPSVALAVSENDSYWTFNFNLGLSDHLNEDEKVTITHGDDSYEFRSDYESKSLTTPEYYALRFGRWKDGRAWEFELIHDKVYLEKNLPDEIDEFHLSDGYNHILINHAWALDSFIVRLGAGTVVSHPDITIEGEQYRERGSGYIPRFWQDGYVWNGYSLHAAVEHRHYFGADDRWFLTSEAKYTYARHRSDIEDVSVRIDAQTIHLNVGLGMRI